MVLDFVSHPSHVLERLLGNDAFPPKAVALVLLGVPIDLITDVVISNEACGNQGSVRFIDFRREWPITSFGRCLPGWEKFKEFSRFLLYRTWLLGLFVVYMILSLGKFK